MKVYILNKDGNWDDYGTGTLLLKKEINEKTDLEEDIIEVVSEEKISVANEEVK